MLVPEFATKMSACARGMTSAPGSRRTWIASRVQSTWDPDATLVYTYPDGTTAADGKVLLADPPRRLKMTFHARWDPEVEAEGPVEMDWVLDASGEATKLTVTTSGLKAGSKTAEEFAGGMVYIVSGLKTVLETGRPLEVGAGA